MLDLESESDSDVSSLYKFICLGLRAVARLAESFTKFPGLCLMIRRGLFFTFNELAHTLLFQGYQLIPTLTRWSGRSPDPVLFSVFEGELAGNDGSPGVPYNMDST